jgi:hypothetical protein
METTLIYKGTANELNDYFKKLSERYETIAEVVEDFSEARK